MSRPTPNEFAVYHENYIMKVKEDDLHTAFNNQSAIVNAFLQSIPDKKFDYAYADGKWTVKQLLQHMIDAERIFAHRALWFARKDPSPQPGFEENDYARAADVSNRSLESLKEEFLAVRKSTECLFKSFSETEFNTIGYANNHPVSVKAIGYILLGHFLHHKNILEERYGLL